MPRRVQRAVVSAGRSLLPFQNMDWRQRITVDPDVLVGKPVVKGTRIAVELVIDLLARGYTTEQVLVQYDHLTADDVQACLAYAAETLRSESVYALPR